MVGSVFRDLLPTSNEVYRLFQSQISKAPLTNCLDDLRTMIETLSTLTSACESVLADIEPRGQETDLFTAVGEIRNVLTWNEFLDTVKRTPSDPNFLFRAHKYTDASQLVFVPDLDITFDLEFRRTRSIDDFAVYLGEHLGKTQKERQIGRKTETYFVSTSPILEWTIHTTGQKWSVKGEDEVVGLAVFDVKKLRRDPDVTIFRVSDFLQFLAGKGKGNIIDQDLQKWAQNCEEYVSVGKIPCDGLVSWVEWEELYSSLPVPHDDLKKCFAKAYTLGKYRVWMQGIQEKYIELEDICQKIVKSGKILAGQQDDLVLPLIELVLGPGIQFWGFAAESSADIQGRIREIVSEMVLQGLSGLSLNP